MRSIKKIIIVGGGTSGWMSAAAMSQCDEFKGIAITLVESDRIGTIGVGEGSTPYLKRFMQGLGFNELDWMQACDATYKTGIYFNNWNGDKQCYFHPFYTSMDVKSAEIFFNFSNARRRGKSGPIKGDDFFVSAHLAKNKLSPVPSKLMPVDAEYGYHFDASKLAKKLKQLAIENGVEHVVSEILQVEKDNGDIKTLNLDNGESLKGDFFIDASGFNALLVGKTLNTSFTSFGEELLNDSAVVVSTPLSHGYQGENYTSSTALSAGWMWNIPLLTRTGNGYVYSSKYLSKEQAEKELKSHINESCAELKVNHLKMKVGMRKTPWVNNVLAIGLAHSFIEPLEATALMITQWTIERFIQLAPFNIKIDKNKKEKTKELFNVEMSRLVVGVKDYIIAHYVTSQRKDSSYWQQSTQVNYSSKILQDILKSWNAGEDFDSVIFKHESHLSYYRPSWYVLLAGMDYRDPSCQKEHQLLPLKIKKQAQDYSDGLTKKYYSH